ncbi:undecaprenyl-diphosphate phosphatase [Bavariicoccus seileri]|uniref:undecaprenyl-diphosphate phosphatase n=1 Tax=Bavariicoccus seileri TaxID=549685 RepID=UPI003F8E626F
MPFIDWLKIVVLGIIEGITEWLPVSSTGHMILFDAFVPLPLEPAFKEMFLVVIQLAAILAVILVFFTKLNPFSPSKTKIERKNTWDTWFKIIIGCLPAAIIGLPLDDFMEKHFFNYFVVALMLILYGILFIVIENRHDPKKETIHSFPELSYKTAFLIGCFQALALVPGTSRSGATILGALILGSSRYIATEFSFFLSVPVMLGASLLKVYKFGLNFTGLEIWIMIVGSVVAFIVSLLAVKFLLNYIKKNDFKPFGWYRIIVGIIVLIAFQFK